MTITTREKNMNERTIISVRNLVKHFPIETGFLRRQVGVVKAVDDVNFDLNEGETLALVGESGCGKTTTSHCIIQAQRPTAGRVLFRIGDADPMDLTQMEKGELKEARRNIRMIYQDPYSSLNPRMTLLQIIGEPLVIHRMVRNQDDLQERVAELLRLVRLDPSTMNRYPHAFSGGQRQRIAIARALSLSPKVVIADEAVSALDVSVQAQILNLLKELQNQLGLTYLFVAHNLAVVKYEADRVAVMYAGKIVEIGETEALYSNPRHPYTEALISAAPNPDPDTKHRERIVLSGEVADPGNLPGGCAFHPRCRYAEDRCRQEMPELIDVGGDEIQSHQAACHFAESLELTGIAGATLREEGGSA
ncbi:MAG: ATP-binding cassette domain-containing protein [Caldilineaceae bacterium]|nr:ATP-binding cassette domain-containing protein [Caldilineaceae bacterium]MDE0630683.1 ATP-binding cassette domain-containing protein [Caldilineaceae bacterium]